MEKLVIATQIVVFGLFFTLERLYMAALWQFALESRVVDENPWHKTRVRVPKKQPKDLNIDVIRSAVSFLEAANTTLQPGWFWSAVLKTLYYTGIRRRQLVGIRMKDVDLDRGIILLRAATSKNRMEREILIADGLRPVLQNLTAKHQHHRTPKPTDQLFNVTKFHNRYVGITMTEQQVSGFFRRLSNELGTPISAHRFRHTFGTSLSPKADLRTVQELMGHSDYHSTMEYISPDLSIHKHLLETREKL